MNDYPHRGPNLSRIRLDAVGGFIYALTPILIALFASPLLVAAFLAAGAVVALLIHWRVRATPRPATHMVGAVSGFVVGIAVALYVGTTAIFRTLVVTSVLGGILVAVLLGLRRSQGKGLSIRNHGTE